MLEFLFKNIIETQVTPAIYFICLGVALALGFCISLAFMYKNRYTKSFVVTLTIIPSVVSLLIMIINGNIGTGIAVAELSVL